MSAAGGPWRVGLYIRLSREDGNDESLSVANQRKILLDHLASDFGDGGVLAGVYIDDGQSGTDQERPGFQRLLGDVRAGLVNCVLCKNLSRAFRNYADQGYYLESFFPRYGTRFIALGEPQVDSFLHPEAVHGLEVPINGLMNDRYAYKTSSDIRRTFDAKRRRGEFIGAFAPYGYRKDPADRNRLLVDPPAAQVVRDIFLWYAYGPSGAASACRGGDKEPAGGMSKEGIAQRLNELGVPNPTAYKRAGGLRYFNPHAVQNDGLWRGSGVAAILSNEVYAGTLVQGRQRVVSYKVHDRIRVPESGWYRVSGAHEAIVSRELFDLVQRLQAAGTRQPPGKRRRHLFAGLLRCADCGKAMTRKPSKGQVYLNCSTYKRKSKARCGPHSLRLDVLEAAVLAALRWQLELSGCGLRLAEALRRAPAKAPPSQELLRRRRELERAQENAKDLAEGLYWDWKAGELTREEYRRLRERLTMQTQRREEALSRLQAALEAQGGGAEEGDAFASAFCKDGRVPWLTQGLLCALVEEILVHADGSLTLRLRFRAPELGPLDGVHSEVGQG